MKALLSRYYIYIPLSRNVGVSSTAFRGVGKYLTTHLGTATPGEQSLGHSPLFALNELFCRVSKP